MIADQLELPMPAAPLTGVKHTCFPDFSLACGLGFLEKPSGDRVHLGRPARWRDVTCDDCRALGRAYAGHIYQMFRERG